jgi:hypothetical protein
MTRPARRELRLSLRCPRTQSYCAGTLSVSRSRPSAHHRSRPLTRRRFRIDGGHVASLTLKLRASALRRLPHRRSLRVLVTVKAHDRAGRRARMSRRLTLPSPPPLALRTEPTARGAGWAAVVLANSGATCAVVRLWRVAEHPELQVLLDAAGGVRTHDLRIKSPLLYQLSYSGGHNMIAYSARSTVARRESDAMCR